jgi:hypothetical protein
VPRRGVRRGLTPLTAGVFRMVEGKIAECWVLPYDQYRFDDIWA